MRKRMITTGIFLGIMIMLTPCFCLPAAGQARYFVSSNGDCGNETPCYSKIQEAIDAAPDGSEILVKQGAYEESICLTSAKTVLVKGGYDSAYSQQTANTTFIQGLGQTTIQASGGSLKFQMLSILPAGNYILVITTTGAGSGEVDVSPSGAAFQPGTVVALTAEADLGSVFTGWGGACSGTQLTCQLTMSEHREVSANFSDASTWTNSLGQTFVLLFAGTFTMGSPSDELGRYSDEGQHQVTLTQSFYMQTTEVTQAQWEAVMGSNPSYCSGCPRARWNR